MEEKRKTPPESCGNMEKDICRTGIGPIPPAGIECSECHAYEGVCGGKAAYALIF